jgi:hypothetical protein
MKIAVAPLREFFFEASRASYAGGVATLDTNPSLPGSREYRFERGEYLYVDTFVTSGEWSGGQTLICQNNVPVWLMQYHGWCKNDDTRVLAFLKQVLRITYENGEFCGGRGPGEHRSRRGDALVYMNWSTPGNAPRWGFEEFRGRERIYREPNRMTDLFWYIYQGQLLGEPE